MTAIFPITALQRTPTEVKKAAENSIVHITEQGAASFIFSSEKAFEQRIAREREDAAYEARLLDAVGAGVADIENGHYFESVEDVFAAADQIKASRLNSSKGSDA